MELSLRFRFPGCIGDGTAGERTATKAQYTTTLQQYVVAKTQDSIMCGRTVICIDCKTGQCQVNKKK